VWACTDVPGTITQQYQDGTLTGFELRALEQLLADLPGEQLSARLTLTCPNRPASWYEDMATAALEICLRSLQENSPWIQWCDEAWRAFYAIGCRHRVYTHVLGSGYTVPKDRNVIGVLSRMSHTDAYNNLVIGAVRAAVRSKPILFPDSFWETKTQTDAAPLFDRDRCGDRDVVEAGNELDHLDGMDVILEVLDSVPPASGNRNPGLPGFFRDILQSHREMTWAAIVNKARKGKPDVLIVASRDIRDAQATRPERYTRQGQPADWYTQLRQQDPLK